MPRFFVTPQIREISDNDKNKVSSDNFSEFEMNCFITVFTILFITSEIIFMHYLYNVYKNIKLVVTNLLFIILFLYLILWYENPEDNIEYDKFNIIVNIMTVVIISQETRDDIAYFGLAAIILAVSCQIASKWKNFNIKYFLFIVHLILFSWSLILYVGLFIDRYKIKLLNSTTPINEKSILQKGIL